MERLRLVCADDPVSAAQADTIRALLESRQKTPVFVEAVPLCWPRAEDPMGLLTRNLLSGRADLACAPAERLATKLAQGITVGGWLRDSSRLLRCVSQQRARLSLLPQGARVATSDAVARAQMLHRYPGLDVELAPEGTDLLKGLQRGRWQAVCVSPAQLDTRSTATLDVQVVESDEVIPTVGLGAIAVLVRAGDSQNRERAERVNEPEAAHLLRAERRFLHHLQRTIGALGTARAVRAGEILKLTGLIVERDGAWLALDEAESHARFGEVIACEVASACEAMANDYRMSSPATRRAAAS